MVMHWLFHSHPLTCAVSALLILNKSLFIGIEIENEVVIGSGPKRAEICEYRQVILWYTYTVCQRTTSTRILCWGYRTVEFFEVTFWF